MKAAMFFNIIGRGNRWVSPMSSVVIFPNSDIEVDRDTAWTTNAFQEFVSIVGLNHDVIMAAIAFPHKPDSRHTANISEETLFRLYTHKKSYISKMGLLGYVASLLRILFSVPKKPIWYVFLPGHIGTLACLICCLLGKPFGAYVRGEWPTSGIAGLLYRWYFKKAAFIFSTGASFTHTLSQYNDQVKEVSPMMRFRVEEFQEKSSYDINGKARILFVGALDPTKGVFELVKALPYVAERCDIELKILGSGSPEVIKELRSEIQTSGCAERIELVGHVGDRQALADWFTSTDVFAFPTYYKEGFPRVVYEAMGFGLPVICTDIEGGKLFLRDNENCRVAAKKDVDSLSNGLVDLLSNQPLRTALGKRAFQDVQELCTRFDGTSHGSQVAEAI